MADVLCMSAFFLLLFIFFQHFLSNLVVDLTPFKPPLSVNLMASKHVRLHFSINANIASSTYANYCQFRTSRNVCITLTDMHTLDYNVNVCLASCELLS